MTSLIIDFIEARLAEDEKAANAAASLCGCHPPAPVWTFDTTEDTGEERIVIEGDAHAHQLKRKLARRWRGDYQDLFHAEYIVRFDPARVLREVAAKRAILARHCPADEPDLLSGHFMCEGCGYEPSFDDGEPHTQNNNECPELQDLAFIWHDHPDYDPSCSTT